MDLNPFSFFFMWKNFSRNLSIQETQSIGCVGTNLLSRCRCRLKLPLCKVQNLCAEFNRDFCKRLHLRRKWEKWGWEKNSSSNLQSCKCISIKVTPDQTEIDRVLTSKAPVLPQGTCVRSLVHTIVCSHTWDSKVASSIFTVCVCSLAHTVRSFLHTYGILRRLCNYPMVRQVVILCMLSILIFIANSMQKQCALSDHYLPGHT